MKALLMIAAALLTGCANYGEYYKSVSESNAHQTAIVRAHAEAEAVRYQALMRIAESGDATAKVAATMALAFSGQQGRPSQAAVAVQPQNEALQWASIIVPGATQGLMGYYSMRTNMRSSDNALLQSLSADQVMLGMGSLIAEPPLVVTQPAPVIVPSPDPVIVNPPHPIIIEPSYPPAVPAP